MKKYEKPEIYSERLVIDSLRAQCCDRPNEAAPQYTPEWWCPPDCTCPSAGGPSN